MSLEFIKEVIKTTTVRVTKQLWLPLVIAALFSLPIVSVIDSPAVAGFDPPPPDLNRTTGRTGSSTR